MSLRPADTVLIFTATASAKGGYGGWAQLRARGDALQAVAGGDRRTTPLRMALTGALEALADATEEDPKAPVRLYTDDGELAAGSAQLDAWRAAGWTDAKGAAVAEQDLWEKLTRALNARTAPVAIAHASALANSKEPIAFVQAWAAFALDIAKTKGAFSSPVPKPNLKALLVKWG